MRALFFSVSRTAAPRNAGLLQKGKPPIRLTERQERKWREAVSQSTDEYEGCAVLHTTSYHT
jgi:hypothetical protein